MRTVIVLTAVAVAVFGPPLLVALALYRAATEEDRMIDRLNNTEGDA